MRLFCHRQPRQTGPVDVPSQHLKQGHKVYRNAGYGHSTNQLPIQWAFSTAPMTPPPYDAYDDSRFQPYLTAPEYRSAMASQQSLPVPNPFASMLDVSSLPASGGWQPQHHWQSTTALVPQRPATHGHPECPIARGMNQGAALCDRIATALGDVICRSEGLETSQEDVEALARGLSIDGLATTHERRNEDYTSRSRHPQEPSKSGGSRINVKKSWLYQNSRLPPGMLPFKAYLPTWTLVCRGAKAAVDVYERPRRDQREYYTDADPKLGTKATIIKSQPVDDRNLVIVAIRGSQWNTVDWLVNVRDAPKEPVGFLDDEGNACHAGFLDVARSMVGPIAARLRDLVEKDVSCCGSSLLFTGHSAGGAVASLLYAHMTSTTIGSDLTDLAGVFKRIHCVTFGAPPVSLLPLQKPAARANRKDVFLSFANEGDLVVRLDSLRYLTSLAKLLLAPAPEPNANSNHRLRNKVSRSVLPSSQAQPTRSRGPPRWPVPDATLSVAGRMVLLREKPGSRDRVIEAAQVTDEELRGKIFGDIAMHPMVLYKRRVDELAFAAISGRDTG